MTKMFIPIASALVLAQAVYGADVYSPVPLTSGSFNADVVVEKTAAPPIENYLTACPDGGTNLTGNGYFEQGYYPTGPYPGRLTWGMPPHGTTFAAQYFADGTVGPDTNFVYVMPPDYTTNNALFISRNNGPVVATLTLVTPGTYSGLSLLNSSGNGGETIGYQVNHQDGSSEQGTFVSTDWFHGNGSAPYPAWMAHCLVSVEGNNLQQIDGNNGDLYHNEITVGTGSPVVSISFTNAGGGGGGRMNVFAISGTTDGVAYTNTLALSGFNYDMIVESNAPNFSMNVAACTATMERGTNQWGRVYMEKGFAGQNASFGLPPAGSTFTSPDGTHSFTLAPSYTAPNTLLVASNGFGPLGGTLTLTTPTAYQALSLLCGSSFGPRFIDVTVHHADSSTESFVGVGVRDWWATGNGVHNGYTNTLALMTEAAFEVDNLGFDIGQANHEELWAIDLMLANTASPVTSVDCAINGTGLNPGGSSSYVVFIMGLAGATGSTTPAYMPAPVTGFNEDMVVEKAAVFRPHALYNATTASMDGGTNNTGNTWYEQGYYKQFPATGLPAAGSTVHSIAQSNSYVMPSSYAANNAAYIDSSHTNANLVPATPAPFTALSFLSSDANGRVTNRVVMQYQDGTSDTNTFVSQDWFNNTPYAFTSQGRVNLDSPAINADPGHNGGNPSSNPRLYEAQVGLNNTSSALTNVSLTFLGGQGGSSRMVVMAVSAATGPYPVIIRGITQSTNRAMEGATLVFSCFIAGGAMPITYNWQVLSNNVWVNLTDGVAGVSGSGTLTNTIVTYTGWMTNAGNPINGSCSFRLQAANAAGTVVSPTATVTLLSGYPDLTSPGDSIATFGAGTGDAGPAGNIDDLVGGNPDVKCLWFANANVGFSTTPSVGSSIARGIRLYWANDADARDPATVILDGSTDGGTTWVNILPQTGVTHNTTRNSAASVAPNPFTQAMQEFDFYGNNVAYTSYRVTFPTVFSTSGNTLTQIGEVEILGQSLNTAPPFFIVETPAAQTVYVGASPTFSVVAGGAPTLHYQWFSNNVAIANATSPSFKLSNAQLANSGNQFYCRVQNINGTTNSTIDTLTVLARPTQAYPAAVLGDHPMAFYRLDEGPDDSIGNNGKVANDYIGGFFGTYSNTVLQAPGYNPTLDSDTAGLFGQVATVDSYVDNIPLSFAAPASNNVALSVEAWVLGSAAQSTDAGIVTIGYGGFEQLNLDCGGADPAHNFRFYVRDASGGTHGPGGTRSANDLRWHHLVGVCDEANSNVVLYVDGVQNGISTGFNSKLGILAATTPLTIGARRQGTTTDYNYQFLGTIDEVAIYNYALTSTQVLAHYYAAAPTPVFSVEPTNTTVDEGATLTLYSAAYGPGTISYQWYDSADGVTFAAMGGQTSSNLVMPAISAAFNNYYFYVVAANANGSVTSTVPVGPGAQVTVVSGPPQIEVDVPNSQFVLAGGIFSLQAQFAGTFPISYQWQASPDGGVTWNNLSNGGRISGATSNVLTIADVQLTDTRGYRLSALNSASGGNPSYSSMDAVTVMRSVVFNTNGAGWQLQGTSLGTGQPGISGNVLVITDGGGSENGSAYFTNKVYVGKPFRVSFTYRAVGIQGNMADGTCFVIQNDARGPSVLSGGGGSFGIAGVSPSAELEINLYPGANGGTGIAFNVNGNNGNVPSPSNPTGTNLSTAPVVLDSGDHIDVVLTYYGAGLIQLNLTDEATAATYSTSFNTMSFPGGADLPVLVGANSSGGYAWVGFSGADGGAVSDQRISNFSMITLPTLSAQAAGGNSAVISWPAPQIGGYVLQSKSDLTSGTWQNVSAPVSFVNGQYQVTITPLTGHAFYRLALP